MGGRETGRAQARPVVFSQIRKRRLRRAPPSTTPWLCRFYESWTSSQTASPWSNRNEATEHLVVQHVSALHPKVTAEFRSIRGLPAAFLG
jgi:hypothetical protein